MNNADILIEHIDFLARNLSGYDKEYVLKIILLEVDIPTRRHGFDYVEEAILLWYEDPMRLLTKEIYPAIAKDYQPSATVQQVDKTIARAIEKAWLKRDGIWELYFSQSQKPTNTEFISRMAKVLSLVLDRCEFLKRVEGGWQSGL